MTVYLEDGMTAERYLVASPIGPMLREKTTLDAVECYTDVGSTGLRRKAFVTGRAYDVVFRGVDVFVLVSVREVRHE